MTDTRTAVFIVIVVGAVAGGYYLARVIKSFWLWRMMRRIEKPDPVDTSKSNDAIKEANDDAKKNAKARGSLTSYIKFRNSRVRPEDRAEPGERGPTP